MSTRYFVVPTGESVLWHARSHQNSKLYEETLNKKLPSCDALRQIYGSGWSFYFLLMPLLLLILLLFYYFVQVLNFRFVKYLMNINRLFPFHTSSKLTELCNTTYKHDLFCPVFLFFSPIFQFLMMFWIYFLGYKVCSFVGQCCGYDTVQNINSVLKSWQSLQCFVAVGWAAGRTSGL